MSNLRIVICGRYQLYSLLRMSQKHIFYQGYNLHSNQKLFIKAESRKDKPLHQLCLAKQSKLYQSIQGGPGIPSLYWCGQDGDFNFLIIQKLDEQNLEQLFEKKERKFSIKTIIQVGLKILDTISYLHIKGLVHNNINPKHILPGVGDQNHQLYLVDFSQTSRYKDIKTGEHIVYKKSREMTEIDPVFASASAHEGFVSSRRDDLESWIYVLIYLINGCLPWDDEETDDWMDMLIKKKQFAQSNKQYQKLPNQVRLALRYIKTLKFEDRPDYSYLRSLLEKLAHKEYFLIDDMYDWMLDKKNGKVQQTVEDLLIHTQVLEHYGESQFLQEQYEIYLKQQEEMNNMSHLLSETINGSLDHIEMEWMEPDSIIQKQTVEKKQCLLF